MLALKTTRLVPLFSGRGGFGLRSTLVMATQVNKLQTNTMSLVAVTFQKNFIASTIAAPACASGVNRFYGTTPPSSSPPSTPSPPNLPDKQQLEKYFFRTVAFLWDTSYWLFLWSRKNFEKYVVRNSTVQLYWKQFQNKLEKARKD